MSDSSSTSKEMVDAKEAEKGVDEAPNINLNDTIGQREAKAPSISLPQNGQLKAEVKDNSAAKLTMENTVVEGEQQQIEANDDKTSGTDADKNAISGSNVQTKANNGGVHDDHEDKNVKLKYGDNAHKGSSRKINIDAGTKNEDNHVDLFDEKSSETQVEDVKNAMTKTDLSLNTEITKDMSKPEFHQEHEKIVSTSNKSFLVDPSLGEGYESGTEDEQAAFAKEVERFYRESNLEYKAPKFYKEELNLLKLWRAVIKLGGYEQVTSCKLWRQVGESFRPPKTCTTVSWTFRIFYEKALLEYEKHKMRNGELPFSDGPLTEPIRVENQAPGSQALGSGRARRDAAARAMEGWHSQRLLGNGQVCHPIIKNLNSTPKGDKLLKTNGLLKRKKPSSVERSVLVPHMKAMKPQVDSMVIDIGPPADWVKINVQKTNDCFEIYALVPGLLREEVHVQSDPAGRLIISGNPEQVDNPWGVTPFKKVVSLPSRIDPHQTSAVVTLHGQLFVRVPFELSDI
ncbi:AT-rich interactive domain-containing protein 6 isoform X2 [Ricinus communis]|uniref:AT-rich interactive domain-containing protein 6 isoform X2 n=1 Tax=Ricinus communis TaxID=3988 RepID=UPI000772482B|nr:AT-rich interactive domain-containing protein 6 isoform X2 [Ricinus communis]|eukprot:XP_015571865.1 AT-rich interactive domain-containing protein 6 isoform X2 [Ricinus communis]